MSVYNDYWYQIITISVFLFHSLYKVSSLFRFFFFTFHSIWYKADHKFLLFKSFLMYDFFFIPCDPKIIVAFDFLNKKLV